MKKCAYCGSHYHVFVQQCENCGAYEFEPIPEETAGESDDIQQPEEVLTKPMIAILILAGVIVFGFLLATQLNANRF
jgi:predicted  nucleic acid-binding Zn-ribbon protein